MRRNPISRIQGLLVLAGLVGVGVLFPAPASAHTSLELRGGYYTDAGDGFLGGGFLTSLAPRWYFNPNLEWVFVDGYDYYTVNADVHRDLNPGPGPAIWLGAGPALLVTDYNQPDRGTNTDFGLNLFGGLGAKYGAVRPFTQVKVTVADNTETSLAIGLRF